MQRDTSETLSRRGDSPADEAYLKLVGERVRVARNRRGMARKVLSKASGVSERYLADLERGSGNASLLVLRQIAQAMGVAVTDLADEQPERPIDLTLAIQQLGRLTPAELAEARRLLIDRFRASKARAAMGRIALIGLRGAGTTSIGRHLAEQSGVTFIELDREIEHAAGMAISELLSLGGQSALRRLEDKCLEAIIQQHERAVIATGGSLVTAPAAFDLLLSRCTVVWLKSTPDAHLGRVVAPGDRRPIADNPQAMADLKASRESPAAHCA